MRFEPVGQTRPRPRSRRPLRLRLALGWSAFVVAMLATGLAVHRLYASVQREVAEQSAVALRQRETEIRERVRTASEALRQSTIKTLVSFHAEGLAHALRQWDDGSAAIVGTFQWDEAAGFLPGSTLPAGAPDTAELAALWRQLWEWRVRNPAAVKTVFETAGPFRAEAARTRDNPAFAAGELGYQGENLDILADAGKPVDPWVGWAGQRGRSDAPWVFWYQAGPTAVVRGCFVAVNAIMEPLQQEMSDRRLARLELVTENSAAAAGDGDRRSDLDAWLPGFALRATEGDLFVEKQSDARLSALAAALLLGVFLLGAAFLALYSRREVRDAERKTNFVTQVSHELRTPLTSIRMFADMLAAPDLPEAKRAKFAGTISRESQRLGTLIERLLTFSALEKGSRAVTVESVDVSVIVQETIDEMDSALRAADLRPELEIPDAPVFAAAESSTVKQALLNVIDNAIKYARDGKILRIALESDAAVVRLRIADGGLGIPRALREQVFEPFVQGGQTLTDKAPGVGLGLSIARGLLRNAGGDLVLLPSTSGAVFEIRLPHVSPS